nr:atpase family gene 2 protein [Quercus suber]
MSTEPSHPFVIRPLPSNTLEGAFRVHLSPESLEKLHLKVGDVCEISSASGAIGHGIAWRAADKLTTSASPKLRPIKMTETLRHAYGFTEGAQVQIAKTGAAMTHAERVRLSAVEADDEATTNFKSWRIACAALLSGCEAFASGTVLEVVARKGLKKKFRVESAEAKGAMPKSSLYYVDDDTTIDLGDNTKDSAMPAPPRRCHGNEVNQLKTEQIGGLAEQVEELQAYVDELLDPSMSLSHVLIHGYEGTGKTLLLDHVRRISTCKVYTLKRSAIVTNTTSKNQALIRETFQTALAQQPSVILLDDLEKLAPVEDESLGVVLRAELEALQDSRVLVVAATRQPSNVSSLITTFERFDGRIELPVPDLRARKHILAEKLGNSDDSISEYVSNRSHGYTGRDLTLLVRRARRIAQRRAKKDQTQLGPTRPIHSSNTNHTDTIHQTSRDGGNAEQASDKVDAARVTETDGEAQKSIVTIDDFNVALASIRPTALREIFLETPRVHWADIGGSELIQRQFDETIGWPLKFPETIERYRIKPSKGVLLYGPPGCSKTLTAQAVANTYGLNFIAIKGAELVSMYVGESERAVREIFQKARRAAPCVIFFDEIDSIGSKRDSSGTKGLNVVTTLLNEMDGFETMNNVLVLAATNQPAIIDPALLRPGRFDSHVYIGPPTDAARRAIIDLSIKGRSLASEVDLDQLVQDTQGYSGAEIVALCNVAKRASLRRAAPESEQFASEIERLLVSDFAVAMEEVRPGITRAMLQAYEDFAQRSAS